jgi:hypothetical protein
MVVLVLVEVTTPPRLTISFLNPGYRVRVIIRAVMAVALPTAAIITTIIIIMVIPIHPVARASVSLPPRVVPRVLDLKVDFMLTITMSAAAAAITEAKMLHQRLLGMDMLGHLVDWVDSNNSNSKPIIKIPSLLFLPFLLQWE